MATHTISMAVPHRLDKSLPLCGKPPLSWQLRVWQSGRGRGKWRQRAGAGGSCKDTHIEKFERNVVCVLTAAEKTDETHMWRFYTSEAFVAAYQERLLLFRGRAQQNENSNQEPAFHVGMGKLGSGPRSWVGPGFSMEHVHFHYPPQFSPLQFFYPWFLLDVATVVWQL